MPVPASSSTPRDLKRRGEKKKRVETVILLTTEQSKARMARKKAKEDAVSGIDVVEEDSAASE